MIWHKQSTIFDKPQARAGMAGGPTKPGLLLMEGCWPVFLHRSLASSRALERFRNQVPLLRSGLVYGCITYSS